MELKPLNNPHLPKSIQNRVSSRFPSICFSYQSSLFQEDFSILWPFRPIFGSYFLYFYQVFSFFCKFGALLRLYAVARSRWYWSFFSSPMNLVLVYPINTLIKAKGSSTIALTQEKRWLCLRCFTLKLDCPLTLLSIIPLKTPFFLSFRFFSLDI